MFRFESLTPLLAACVISMSCLMYACSTSQQDSVTEADSLAGVGTITLNQLGFLPHSAKWAVISKVSASQFAIVNATTETEVMRGNLGDAKLWKPAEETVKLANFSKLTAPGDYYLRVEGIPGRYRFVIADNAYRTLGNASLKAFYFNRASTELRAAHAGIYARAEGHPDNHILIHASAVSSSRPEGSVISSPKGWYDAGDYNKYIVNSGISTYTLLAAYEHFPEYFQQQFLNIPESNNSIPDLLDETLWNLDWMLTMQDPSDGGVYHKLTNKQFDGKLMPAQAKSERYVVQKTTAAALDFAAVMAVASRVFRHYEVQRPGLSEQMLTAAQAAWRWAQANPGVIYQQPTDIVTGEYGDQNLSDEFAWAAAELYITTQDDHYYAAMKPETVQITVPDWADVSALAWISLAHHQHHLTSVADTALISGRVSELANHLLNKWQTSAYKVSMDTGDFVWGSNAVALNQAMVLLQAYRLDAKRSYLDAAQSLLDYVLGRNATDTSFVTGFGRKYTLHPHHRPSEADGIAEPIPGFVAGGPQPGQQDKAHCRVAYPSSLPAKSYLDDNCSYASNEIAINWNAPLVYVSAAIQVLTPR